MTTPKVGQWTPWPNSRQDADSEANEDLEQHWKKPGVYALVSTTKGYRTVLDQESRVLYIGEAGNLCERLRYRKNRVSDGGKPLNRPRKRSHSVLWYLDDVAIEGQQSDLPEPLVTLLGKIERQYKPRVFLLAVDEKGKNKWNNGKHKAPRKLLEELLLLEHFFKLGQFPPLNAKVLSIMSIARYWTTTKKIEWWESCWKNPEKWQLPNVKTCWEELKSLGGAK